MTDTMIETGGRENDEWAVVLGVTGGTGGAVARAVASNAGLNVFGVHRGNHPEAAREVAAAVEGAGRRMHLRKAGAGTWEEAEAGVAEVLDTAGRGRVRLLVHAIANASYCGLAMPWRDKTISPDRTKKTFDSMAHSFVYWVKMLLDAGALAPGARLVAFTNPMVDSAVHGWGMVAAAKAALEIYVKQLGHELGPLGYRVVMVKFGMVETEAIRTAFKDDEWERVKSEIAWETPARRLSTCEEVADFVAYLCGDGGEWFTAGTVDATGGQTGALLDGIFNKRQEA